MMPRVPFITIKETAEKTGRTWEEVAKEKMKVDFTMLGVVLGIIFILLLIF